MTAARTRRAPKYGDARLDTGLNVRLTKTQRAQLDRLARRYYGENVSYALRLALAIGIPALEARAAAGEVYGSELDPATP